MQICVRTIFFVFIFYSAKVQPPTSDLLLAVDHCFLVRASGHAGSYKVGVTETFRYVARLPLQSTQVKVRGCYR